MARLALALVVSAAAVAAGCVAPLPEPPEEQEAVGPAAPAPVGADADLTPEALEPRAPEPAEEPAREEKANVSANTTVEAEPEENATFETDAALLEVGCRTARGTFRGEAAAVDLLLPEGFTAGTSPRVHVSTTTCAEAVAAGVAEEDARRVLVEIDVLPPEPWRDPNVDAYRAVVSGVAEAGAAADLLAAAVETGEVADASRAAGGGWSAEAAATAEGGNVTLLFEPDGMGDLGLREATVRRFVVEDREVAAAYDVEEHARMVATGGSAGAILDAQPSPLAGPTRGVAAFDVWPESSPSYAWREVEGPSQEELEAALVDEALEPEGVKRESIWDEIFGFAGL